METGTRGTGKIVKEMVLDLRYLSVVLNMKEVGRTAITTAKEFLLTPMDLNGAASGLMVKR